MSKQSFQTMIKQYIQENNYNNAMIVLAAGIDNILDSIDASRRDMNDRFRNLQTDVDVIDKIVKDKRELQGNKVYDDYTLFNMNQQGKSYADIEKITGIKKSTVAKKVQKIKSEVNSKSYDDMTDQELYDIYNKTKGILLSRGFKTIKNKQ